MDRGMRRSGQQVSPDECRRVLSRAGRAVLSVNGDGGYPYGMPVNFYYDPSDDVIYLHGAKEGHRVDALRRDGRVCFTVWDDGYREEGDWAWHVTSVVILGRAELIDDISLAEDKVRRLGLKYSPYPDEVEADIRSAIGRVQLIAIHIEDMKGKLVHEK